MSFCALVAALVALAALPAAGRAQSFTFINPSPTSIGPTASGPATPYPSSISVSGLSGTVAKASVLLLDVTSEGYPEDLDLAIVGPTGAKVMLWSDACGDDPFTDLDFVFDDASPVYLSFNSPCAAGTYHPSNYLGNAPEPDDLSAGGTGPSPPYSGNLSSFNGTSPNGAWNLYAYFDNFAARTEIAGWALTLQIQPPPTAALETGQRATALAKCKEKRKKLNWSKKRYKNCKRAALKLPI